MLEGAEYVIVPHTPGYEQDQEKQRLLDWVKDGYRIISKANATLGVHYVLIKFKEDTRPPKPKPTTAANEDDDEGGADKPLDLDDIPF